MNTFKADLRMSCVLLPSGELWQGQCLCVFLHTIQGGCAMGNASVLAMPSVLLPEGHDLTKDLGPDIVPLPDLDWSDPLVLDLKREAIQNWLRDLPQLRTDLEVSEDQLRAMLQEAPDALPF